MPPSRGTIPPWVRALPPERVPALNQIERQRPHPGVGAASLGAATGWQATGYGFGAAGFASSAGATALKESSAVTLKSWYWFTRPEA